jgi:hypothetical protein
VVPESVHLSVEILPYRIFLHKSHQGTACGPFLHIHALTALVIPFTSNGPGRVRVQIYCTRGTGPSKPLNKRDGTRFCRLLSLPCIFDEVGCNRAVDDAQRFAHQLWAIGEQESQLSSLRKSSYEQESG